jgi:menaquinone-dependent protoporphyrinogen oxidase
MPVLVAHASKRGSTAAIAEAVAATLREQGLEVDCRDAGEVDDIGDYDAVVLGSAVYVKRWQGDAKHFLRKHGETLASLPFWVFSSGPVGDPADDDPEWLEPPKIIKRATELGARDHVVFGGSVPAEPHGLIERSMAGDIAPEFRDRRDWDEIAAWSRSVAGELASLPS